MTSMKDYVDEMMNETNENNNNEQDDIYEDYYANLICPFCKCVEINMLIRQNPHNDEDRIIFNQCTECERTWVAANIEGDGQLLEIDLRPLFPKKPE